MAADANTLARRLRGRRAPSPPLDALKLGALDLAHRRFAIRTAADLGAVWAVEAGYTFHLASREGIASVIAVDEDFTPTVVASAEAGTGVRLLAGNFGDPAIAAEVGKVDAVVMFDVLLHQVAPDWDEVLALWAANADVFILAGPWYTEGPASVRLLDLGEEHYLRAVPEQAIHEGLFDRLDEINPRRHRPWRDVHDIWQWGITDEDLRRHLRSLGFELAYFEHLGPWRSLPSFANAAYVFARPERIAGAS